LHDEPIMDVAHLGHIELLTPKPDESLRFFVDVLGMTESGRQGQSVYLRGWDDYERYSLKLTGSHTSGLGHAAFRARSPQALQRRIAALQQSGLGIGWHEGELGHGPAYQFHDPDGHLLEIYYETEWYEAPENLRPALKNQAQRVPGRGVNVRRLDHFNCLSADIKADREFFQQTLGFRLTEQIVLDDGTEAGMWLTATNKSYDFAYTREAHGVRGRFHHVTFALDSRRRSCKRPTFSSRTVCSSRPGRTSTRCSRPSSSTSTNPAATGWRSPMPAHAWCLRRIGNRSPGRRRSARRARPGA
jgi:catechol 2,3-dioxygenase